MLAHTAKRGKKMVLGEYLYLSQASTFLAGAIKQRKLNPVLCTLLDVAAFCNKKKIYLKRQQPHSHLCTYKNSAGWSGGAMVLGKLPVPGRPTNFDYSRARAYCACSRCRWG